VRSSIGSPSAPETPSRRPRRELLLWSLYVAYIRPLFQERLTARGRYVLWATLILGGLGADTNRSQSFLLFAIGAAVLLLAAAYAVLPPPLARLECELPARAAARTPLRIRARVTPFAGRPSDDLRLSFPRPRRWSSSIRCEPGESFLDLDGEHPAEVSATFEATRRGRYLLPGPTLRRTDPLRLVTGRARRLRDQVLLAYPRFFTYEEFSVPIGRRYQPGGIPLSSNLGESIEFVGTREYREGDPIRNIHWRSWARRGEPVVKEYMEEYFCRIAIVLDTFSRPRPRPEDERAFEASVSVVASIADFFSRSEYVVDILAAGPDLYEVSAGRSLAYLENILDVLACLEPCPDAPFEGVGPALFDKLAQITTVVAVLQDWDDAREDFLRRVKALGTSVRTVIVHEGPTSRPWTTAEDLGEVSLMTPQDVERRMRATGSIREAPAPGLGAVEGSASA
jgi:uncharacterized protein (DUF58 family)